MKLPPNPEGIEKAFPKLTLSLPTYNELANAIEQRGGTILNRQGNLILEKGTMLVPPVDLRQTTIRRDVLVEVVKLYHGTVAMHEGVEPFLKILEQVYNWVYTGTMPTETNPKSEGWN